MSLFYCLTLVPLELAVFKASRSNVQVVGTVNGGLTDCRLGLPSSMHLEHMQQCCLDRRLSQHQWSM